MNIMEFLTDILPISASLLSVAASIAASVLAKKMESFNKHNSKISIKWNDKEIEINNYSEKEIQELITKLKSEDMFQKDSS